MKRYKTLICLILDESGSMHTKKSDVIGGFNAFLEAQLEVTDDDARFLLIKFNNTVRVVYKCVDLNEVPELTNDAYRPGGGTALYDAVSMGILIAKKEKKKHERVICVVMTDGEENSSRRVKLEQIREEISDQSNDSDWSFIYIGQNPDRWCKETSMSQSYSQQYSHHSPASSFSYASSTCSSLRSSQSSNLDALSQSLAHNVIRET